MRRGASMHSHLVHGVNIARRAAIAYGTGNALSIRSEDTDFQSVP
jgi:hypothetical protein